MSRFVFVLSCCMILLSGAFVMAQLDGPMHTPNTVTASTDLTACMKTRDFCGK